METGLGGFGMYVGGQGQRATDRFIFIGCGTKQRKDLIYKLRERCIDVEILAPVEKRMIRPRRKSSKREARFIEVPLFYEYLAVNFEPMAHDWEWVAYLDEVWFMLMGTNLMPKTVQRSQLKGFLSGDSLVSWEGATVEFTRGPLVGRRGTFSNGRVCLGQWGKPKANVFDLVRVA